MSFIRIRTDGDHLLFVQARVAKRKEYFQAIDKDGKGHITFNDWLDYAFQHIAEKAASL